MDLRARTSPRCALTSPWDVPDLVRTALQESLRAGYVEATRSETGRLLATLAASRDGVIADFGTGGGVGAAWLRSGARPGTRVLTIERDPELAAAAQGLFADHDIEVLRGDWSTMDWASHDIEHFSLLTLALHTARSAHDRVIDLLEPGGVLVLDEVSEDRWDEGADALLRQSWLNDPRLVCAEINAAPDACVLIATRV